MFSIFILQRSYRTYTPKRNEQAGPNTISSVHQLVCLFKHQIYKLPLLPNLNFPSLLLGTGKKGVCYNLCFESNVLGHNNVNPQSCLSMVLEFD